MTKTYEDAIGKAFQDGAKYVLEYLEAEVYGDSITETDIWKDFFGCPDCQKSSAECECRFD